MSHLEVHVEEIPPRTQSAEAFEADDGVYQGNVDGLVDPYEVVWWRFLIVDPLIVPVDPAIIDPTPNQDPAEWNMEITVDDIR